MLVAPQSATHSSTADRTAPPRSLHSQMPASHRLRISPINFVSQSQIRKGGRGWDGPLFSYKNKPRGLKSTRACTRRQVSAFCLWPREPYPPSRQMPHLDARHERVRAMPHGRACYCGRSFGEHVTCLCVLKASGEQHEEMPNLGVKT